MFDHDQSPTVNAEPVAEVIHRQIIPRSQGDVLLFELRESCESTKTRQDVASLFMLDEPFDSIALPRLDPIACGLVEWLESATPVAANLGSARFGCSLDIADKTRECNELGAAVLHTPHAAKPKSHTRGLSERIKTAWRPSNFLWHLL